MGNLETLVWRQVGRREFGSRNSDLDVTAAAEFSWPATAVAATLITPTLSLPRFSDLYGDYVI